MVDYLCPSQCLNVNGHNLFINKGTNLYHISCVKTNLRTLMIPGPSYYKTTFNNISHIKVF